VYPFPAYSGSIVRGVLDGGVRNIESAGLSLLVS